MSEESAPTREEMIDFLREHFRYHTMSSWNNATSYARNVKIYNLGLTREQKDRAYDIIYADGAYDRIDAIIHAFEVAHEFRYQMGFNGRSGGYIVLYEGGQKPSGYQSYCTFCGQLNYKKVAPPAETPEDVVRNHVRTNNCWVDAVYLGQSEIIETGVPGERVLEIVREVKQELEQTGAGYTAHNECGVCGNPGRINFVKPHMQTYSRPGAGMDMDDGFEDWDDDSLKSRYDLIKEFDTTVDECISAFRSLVDSCKVVEKEIMVPKTIRVLECAGASE